MERVKEGKIKLGYNLSENRFLKRMGARIEIVSVKDKEAYWIPPEGSELFCIGYAPGGEDDLDSNGEEREYEFYMLRLVDGQEFPLRVDGAVMSPNWAVSVAAFPKNLQMIV